jgi:hypothetical protein
MKSNRYTIVHAAFFPLWQRASTKKKNDIFHGQIYMIIGVYQKDYFYLDFTQESQAVDPLYNLFKRLS